MREKEISFFLAECPNSKSFGFSPYLHAGLSATAGHGALIRKRIYSNAVSVAKHKSETRQSENPKTFFNQTFIQPNQI